MTGQAAVHDVEAMAHDRTFVRHARFVDRLIVAPCLCEQASAHWSVRTARDNARCGDYGGHWPMSGLPIGYARVSTNDQDRTAQRDTLGCLLFKVLASRGVQSGPHPYPRRHGRRQSQGELRGKRPKLTTAQEKPLVELLLGRPTLPLSSPRPSTSPGPPAVERRRRRPFPHRHDARRDPRRRCLVDVGFTGAGSPVRRSR